MPESQNSLRRAGRWTALSLAVMTCFSLAAGDFPLTPDPLRPNGDADSRTTAESVVGGGSAPSRPAVLVGGEIGGGTEVSAPPAWAARRMPQSVVTQLPPFGVNLFQGNFTNTRPDGLSPGYRIIPGDQITIRLWGTQNHESSQVVDHQGNIFLPEVGPIAVGGVEHGRLNDLVRRRVREIYPSGVEVYTNLLTAQPLSVYVSGFVSKPGRYAGGPDDSVLAFIDRAGGIIGQRGSYRGIKVMRGRNEVASVDLYDFLLRGILPADSLEEGDVILVGERGPSVAVLGDIRQPARYEFPPVPYPGPDQAPFSGSFSGAELVRLASPLDSVTHVAVAGARAGRPFNVYLVRTDFSAFMLSDNDVVEFLSDRQAEDIMVKAAGEVIGDQRFPVKKGVTLLSLLPHIAVDQSTADVDAIYLRRQSVAEQQRKSIADSLQRLEQMALTATSATPAEAEIRVREAAMIQDFVRRARLLEPDGVLVVRQDGRTADILLEDGDIIVIPPKRQVVQVSGEVRMPQVMAFRDGTRLERYISAAGGFSRRADRRNILVVSPNGEVFPGRSVPIQAGDHIIVLPRYESKNLLLLKDLTQVLYQIAIATKVALDL